MDFTTLTHWLLIFSFSLLTFIIKAFIFSLPFIALYVVLKLVLKSNSKNLEKRESQGGF